MTKRRGRRTSRQSGREHPADRKPTRRREGDGDLDLTLQRASRWLDRGHPEEALELLEPLEEKGSRNPDVHYLLGYARIAVGEPWGAMSAFEEARRIQDRPDLVVPLIGLYAEVGFPAHTLEVWEVVEERGMAVPHLKEIRQLVAAMQEGMAETAEKLDVSLEQARRGHYDLEEGRKALAQGDYRAAITLNRRAAKRMGNWPSPRNNLALALFYAGRVDEAIEEVRRVLSVDAQNLQALANGVRFLGWSGREEEARELWSSLEDVAPGNPNQQFKKAEAAAVLKEHESVYQILKPLDERPPDELESGPVHRAHFFLAVAEANTGRRRRAMQRLKDIEGAVPQAAETLAALRAGREGTGWLDHFAYFSLLELLPPSELDALLDLVTREEEIEPDRYEREVRRFGERFPQIVLLGEKMIWEEQQWQAGVAFLSAVGTPEAYAALRRFALSQAGEDEARIAALAALAEAGQVDEDAELRLWLDGEWRQVEMRAFKEPVGGRVESNYAPRVVEELNRASWTQEQGDQEAAEEMYKRVLELDPSVKEAYNNLAVIYSQRAEFGRAQRMLRKAVDIDPLYVPAVCNLAHHLLDQDREAQAEELLAPLEPLVDAGRLSGREESSLYFALARVRAAQFEFEAAKQLLEAVLRIKPDHEAARNMLEWIESFGPQDSWAEQMGEEAWLRQWQRDLAWRSDLQMQLDTLDPTLADTLPLYTKAALKETGWQVMPWGGWSTLRKAELVTALIEALADEENLARLVDDLTEEEKDALSTVLDAGGALNWDEFEILFGSDLDETRHWEYHTPETTMGWLRMVGLLAEATVDGELYVVIPADLREPLKLILE